MKHVPRTEIRNIIEGPARHLDEWYGRCTQDHEDVKLLMDRFRATLSGKYAARKHYEQITELCLAVLALDARVTLLEEGQWSPERTVRDVGSPDAWEQLALFDPPSGPSTPAVP